MIRLVGSHQLLGRWDLNDAVMLETSGVPGGGEKFGGFHRFRGGLVVGRSWYMVHKKDGGVGLDH